MNRDSQTRMTNDQIRRDDQIRMTKPATAQLRAIGHSGFGFLSSLVIRHRSFNGLCKSGSWSQCMRKNEWGLPMNRPTPGPSQEGSRRPVRAVSVPLLGGVRGGFIVPMRAQSERGLSMNQPLPVNCPVEPEDRDRSSVAARGPRQQPGNVTAALVLARPLRAGTARGPNVIDLCQN